MGSADDRTFKVNFSEEGVAKLSEKVRDKLKEFMGDYTDETLVEYVIVLLRNGRDKQAARDELNVFLEDDSDSFVSWLWDHLASNVDLYVHRQESCTNEVAKTRSAVVGQPGENEPHRRDLQFDSVNSDNLSRSRHKREWKDLGRDATEPPPLQSSEVGNVSSEDKGNWRATRARSPSPQPPQHRKRSRQDEQQQRKRDTASLPTLDAPRRLLQFAVRDAVGTPRQSGMVKESPSAKRLRSIVSTPTVDLPLVERPRRIQSIARVPNAMATVVRAVKEAAEDVRKVRSGVSVFDRLGRDMDISAPREQVKEFRDADVEDGDYVEFNEIQEETCMRNLRAGDYVRGTTNARMVESDTGLNSVSMSDGGGYDDVNRIGHGAVGVSQTGLQAGTAVKNALISQHSAAMNVDEVMPMAKNKEQNILASAPNSSCKRAKSSVNVNTWKPPNTLESGDVGGMANPKSVLEIEPEVKYGGQMMTENNSPVVIQNQSVKPPTEMQKESQKTVLPAPGSYTAGRPLEDADSRTIFVSNVHFAATKDSLSRHFNKFGDVLKVIIVTDATTGQPKGSAYVEFLRKEAADNALSLDGTSFMSRILKVVKRSSAHHDTTPLMTWPRIARGSPYATPRFPRAPFPRGISGGFRARVLVKPGARSMQWKRGDAQATQAESGAPPSGHGIISQTSRSLTYIRTESKLDGNSGTA